ncbi:hypothetical protein SAMN05216257_103138 [Meinhardsimonia xiamenensis]|jgi:uncharacterized protein YjeT (DUF2065 family)|uniref:DUF2065 domain-containing protein n=1 Tax=Meinhardsimonia xiamenensis TaxID=990712 RepID=A0A1G9CJU0_9RHOB|nr:DUF2065 domain-containing protein [Meinhardsimonia xiamenensis]PRX38335.1 hypothetical protein LV81_00616 [Meinhardsimonia xiamenensis]SDK51940.1 hypothetical protein SAMN05216257_103138 [Meinhardsimonia xiamenensis]
MLATVILAIGLVFIVEGLVFALAPSRLEEILAMLARLPLETRRLIGLGAMTLGVVLVALARSLGA